MVARHLLKVFALENWGKVMDNNIALIVGTTTPKALRLLDEFSLLEGKTAVIGHIHFGGYAYERINDHACKVTYLGCVDMKGRLPYWITNKEAENSCMKTYSRYTKQFGRPLHRQSTEQIARR